MEAEIFRLERFSVKNGPGIRTTVFFKGCPLRCVWCSNPESQEPGLSLLYNPEICLRDCDECVKICPWDALAVEEGRAVVNRGLCRPCGECSSVCPAKALSVQGERIATEVLLERLERDRSFFETSGGGVTLSGGEPLFQPGASIELLTALKKRGLHSVLDTSGEAPESVFRAAIEITDLVLFDLKIADSDKHAWYTGLGNERILENLLTASRTIPGSLVVRIPVIPGVNDGESDAAAFAGILKNLPKSSVNLLPYHRLGETKYAMLGKPYALAALKPPPREHIAAFAGLLEKQGVSAVIVM